MTRFIVSSGSVLAEVAAWDGTGPIWAVGITTLGLIVAAGVWSLELRAFVDHLVGLDLESDHAGEDQSLVLCEAKS